MLRRTLIAASIAAFASVLMPAVPASAGGYCRGVPVTDGTGTTVELKDACFTPTVLHVKPGQAITWVNRDGFAHMVIGANAAWGGYDELQRSDSVTYRFDAPGVYPYFCFLHIGMIGAVVVGDGSAAGTAESVSLAAFPVPSSQAPGSAAGSDATPVGAVAGGAALGIGLAVAATWFVRHRRRDVPVA